MISNCGHDENNKYSGGKAGDQTKGEWAVINWYSRPWTCVLRHPNAKVRKMIASMAKAAAKNNLIGYDQSQRYTFWEQLKASEYDPEKIAFACEADCSAGVAAIVKGTGYRLNIQKLKDVSIYLCTSNIRPGLKSAGFEVLTDSKYLTSDSYLYEGDILLCENHHVATNLTTGSKATSGLSIKNSKNTEKVDSAAHKDKSLTGTYTTTSDLNLRTGAGTSKKVIVTMPKGSEVNCYGYYNYDGKGRKWLYVNYSDGKTTHTGYAKFAYLKQA